MNSLLGQSFSMPVTWGVLASTATTGPDALIRAERNSVPVSRGLSRAVDSGHSESGLDRSCQKGLLHKTVHASYLAEQLNVISSTTIRLDPSNKKPTKPADVHLFLLFFCSLIVPVTCAIKLHSISTTFRAVLVTHNIHSWKSSSSCCWFVANKLQRLALKSVWQLSHS